MNSRVLAQIAYPNHLQTLRSLGIAAVGLTIFDATGRIVWSEGSGPEHERTAQDARDMLHRENLVAAAGGRSLRCELADGAQVFLGLVDDDADARLLEILLVVRMAPGSDADVMERIEQALTAVGANMLNEYHLNSELESMATELADRYEELNLVFQSDNVSKSILYGFESLRRLVKDTVEFLGVGMAALVLPTRDLEVYDLDEAMSISNVPELLSSLRRQQFGRAGKRQKAIVINSVSDVTRAGMSGEFPCKLMIMPVDSGYAETVGMLVVANNADCQDFTNSDRNLVDVMAKKVTRILQSNFDALTGLENSHSFEWAVGQALLQARSRGLRHALLHVDIDRTNVINDISSREAGDEVIRLVAKILADSVRAHDAVARVGGDEFGILLETCSLQSAASLAEKITRRVEATDFGWKGTMHPLSVCIGVAPITGESESVAAVLSAAGVARDAAKEKGRNRIQVYEQNDVDLLRRRGEFQWVGQIQRALREGGFVLHAQLIQPLKKQDDVPHYEVLVRMRAESGELIPPGKFIPAAEHYHLMPDLDGLVVQQAVQALRTVTGQSGSPPVRLSINLSGQSLSDDSVKAAICDELRRLGPLAAYVCLEITESSAIANLDEALAFIQLARGLGCRFSLDDFGSGLSSFAYLQKFNVDYLKIDGSFVRRIDHDPVSLSMVSAINQVGQMMGLSTVAEFVESPAIVERLSEIGVDYAQGYHFSVPMPLQEILRQLVRTEKAAQG